MKTHCALAFALVAASAGTAAAQSAGRATVVETSESLAFSDSGSYRSKANDWMVAPSGTTVLGGAFQFLTADAGLGDDGVDFTDVVLFGINVRHTFATRFEVFGSASLLPKQPSFTDELAWQGASAGMLVGFGKRYAVHAAASGGPTLGNDGLWIESGSALHARKSLHRTFVLEGGVGGSYTALIEDDRPSTSWLAEVTVGGEMTFRAPNGMAAGWLATEIRVPVAHDSAMSDAGAEPYDPQTRVNAEIGVVLSYIDEWDIFAKLAVVDRGDAVDPSTTLPILHGGFDQTHLIVGLIHRWKGDTDSGKYAMVAE